jgi:hypothetical protein
LWSSTPIFSASRDGLKGRSAVGLWITPTRVAFGTAQARPIRYKTSLALHFAPVAFHTRTRHILFRSPRSDVDLSLALQPNLAELPILDEQDAICPPEQRRSVRDHDSCDVHLLDQIG